MPKASSKLRRSFDADFPTEESPGQAAFFRQETQPGFAVGGQGQVGVLFVAVRDSNGSVLDNDRGDARLFAREREVEDSVQPLRLAPLKRMRHAGEEPGDRPRMQGASDMLDSLVREPFADVGLRVRFWHDVDRLLLVLEWLHDLVEKSSPVSAEWPDHVVPGRANGQAVGRLVIRAKGQALPG